MSMSKRQTQQQRGFWINTENIVTPGGHPFYRRLNELLDEHGFDRFVESRCERFYDQGVGRPRITRGVNFRLLLIG